MEKKSISTTMENINMNKMYYNLLNKIFPDYFSDLNIDLKYFCSTQYNIKKALKEMNDLLVPVNIDNLTEAEIYFYHKVVNKVKKFITTVLTPSKKIINIILDSDKIFQKKFLLVIRSQKYQYISPFFMIDLFDCIMSAHKKTQLQSNAIGSDLQSNAASTNLQPLRNNENVTGQHDNSCDTNISIDIIYNEWLKTLAQHYAKFIAIFSNYRRIFAELFSMYVLTCPLNDTTQIDHRFNLLNDVSLTIVKCINDLTDLCIVDQLSIVSQLVEPYIPIDILREEFVIHI